MRKNQGTCYICQQTVTHLMIKKHVGQCLKKEIENNNDENLTEKEKVFLIKFSSGPAFWLYLEIKGSSKLEDLDQFLRDIWLECCGHMSQFVVDGKSYVTNLYESGGISKVIHRTLKVGTLFSYEYDFGSTTELDGEVISSRAGNLHNDIRLLARNTMPEDVVCSICQKSPEVICSLCYDFFCKKCRKNHACQEDKMMLPVVNSPRMGVCAYCGPEEVAL